MRGKPGTARDKRKALLKPKGQSRTTVHPGGVPHVAGEAVWLDDRTVGQLRELQGSLGLASEGDVIAWLCIQLRAIKGAGGFIKFTIRLAQGQ
jgi:hypothetical protein